jgi:hypothetical protein
MEAGNACRYNWYDAKGTTGGKASITYVGVYAGLTVAFFFIQTLRTGGFFLWAKNAADRSMRRSLHRVLNSPMAFYLSKPVGELLATFSSDQDKIDEALPDALHLACVLRLHYSSFFAHRLPKGWSCMHVV